MANWSNCTVWTGDNLNILQGMNSDSVDLIYADPPFNSKANYAAPIGSKAAGAAFKDTWSLSDVDAEWIDLIEAKHPALHRVLLAAMTDSDKSYLAYMAARLLEMRRVLQPFDADYVKRFYRYSDERGQFMVDNLTGSGLRDGDTGQPWHDIDPSERGRHWAVPQAHAVPDWIALPDEYPEMTARQRLDVLDREGLIYWPPKGSMPRFKRYLSPESGAPVADMVLDVPPLSATGKERIGYPTQKPLALLRRIIAASSNPGDVVCDPFCGCATALIAAEELQREWIGIDVSPKAAELIQVRMRDELGLFYDGAHRTDVPKRTDLGDLPPYRTHRPTL